MGSVAQFFGRAVGWHRQALALLLDAEAELRALESDEFPAATADVEQRRRAALLHDLARAGLRGWLGAKLDGTAVDLPLGGDAVPDRPMFVKVGEARPTSDSVFWAVAPFIGAGHLAVDADVRDPAVAAWLRGVLLRAAAALPDGTLRVLPVDGATLGSVFAAFRPLMDAEAWAPPATDLARLRSVLDEAERQISAIQGGGLDNPPVLLVAVAALPSGASRADWARLAAVAHAGPAARVHLLLAGWPPHTYGESAPRLDHTTYLSGTGEGWYRMSEPPGPHRLSDDGSGLAAPLRLDAGASEDLIAQVCRRLAATATVSRRTDFTSLMPRQIWQESSAAGLSAIIGRDGRESFTLSLNDATPHALLAGRSGAGKTNVLLVLLYALTSRYSPDELGLYLLDFKEGVSFVEFTPTAADPSWVPHARTVGIESDREYGLAVLRTLTREMNRRAGALKAAGATSLTGLRALQPDTVMPRLVVVIDEFQVLLAGNDTIARDAVAGLEDLARKGRSYGIHLILASQTIAGIEALYTKKDSILGSSRYASPCPAAPESSTTATPPPTRSPSAPRSSTLRQASPRRTGPCGSRTPIPAPSPRSGTPCGSPERRSTTRPQFSPATPNTTSTAIPSTVRSPHRSAAARPSSAAPSTWGFPPSASPSTRFPAVTSPCSARRPWLPTSSTPPPSASPASTTPEPPDSSSPASPPPPTRWSTNSSPPSLPAATTSPNSMPVNSAYC